MKSKNGGSLESGLRSKLVSDFLNKSLERKLSDKKLSRLLVSSDFSSGNSSWSESVWFLNASGGWGRLLSSLGVELFSWFLDSMRALSCGGLCSCHVVY